VVTRLAAATTIGRVVAIDDHRGDVAGVTWRVADVRDPSLASKLEGVDVVVHADMDTSVDTDPRQRRAFNLRGAQTVLTVAAAERIGRVVLLSSAMVYGARPDNPVPLPEDAPLLAAADGSVAGDMLEVEQLARRSRRVNPATAVAVVRPAALVGETIDTLLTRHFEAPRLLAVRGCAPRWQFCHVDDLVSAVELAAIGAVTGDFAVGSDGWLAQDEIEELCSGLRPDVAFQGGDGGLCAPDQLDDEGWIGRYQALKSEIKTININPAVSFKVTDQFWLGAGANYQNFEATLTNNVNYSGALAQG
jgi:nucleoside-diphosphate-sugar epimerase